MPNAICKLLYKIQQVLATVYNIRRTNTIISFNPRIDEKYRISSRWTTIIIIRLKTPRPNDREIRFTRQTAAYAVVCAGLFTFPSFSCYIMMTIISKHVARIRVSGHIAQRFENWNVIPTIRHKLPKITLDFSKNMIKTTKSFGFLTIVQVSLPGGSITRVEVFLPLKNS